MPRFPNGKIIFYLFLLLILDASVTPLFASFRPILIYLIVPYAVLEGPAANVLPVAFLTGFLRDLLASGPFGIETLAVVLGALLLDFLVRKIEHQFLFVRLLVCWMFLLFVSFTAYFFSYLFIKSVLPLGQALETGAVTALVTTALMPVFFLISGRYFGVRATLKQYELFP